MQQLINPSVTFIVPCYKLAHFLWECVESILSQTYSDFEVLIMDDCSPDRTPEIAASFADPRVKHVRNNYNLGNLRNYNEGIRLARGKYVWLISADDYLRNPEILERYVSLLEQNPKVGYTCCAGMSIVDGRETEVVPYSVYARNDCIVNGHVFLERLLRGNFVLAASGLVRRECYDRLGVFPLSREMTWSGDWYLWALFALHYDVAFFAEAMVGYREHGLSMTNILKDQNSDIIVVGDIAVPWLIKKKADAAGFKSVSRCCLESIVYVYTTRMTRSGFRISWEEFEESLVSYSATEAERAWVRARVYAGVGDHLYWARHLVAAREHYLASLRRNPLSGDVLTKLALLACGNFGHAVRRKIRQRVDKGSLQAVICNS